MKKQALGIIAIFIVICQFNLSTLFAQQVRYIPYQETEIPADRKMDNPEIKVELKVDIQQPLSREGLKFAIIITNLSGNELELYNPLDMSSIMLKNEKGIPISIRRTALFTAQYANFYVPNFESFDVGKTLLNGKVVKIDFFNTENIKLPANSSMEINLSISNVITDPRSRKELNPSKSKITKGKYLLSVTTRISSRRFSKRFFFKSMDTPETTISYGQ